ncbi:MAG: cell division protein ZapE [Cardiobacteriaceae bacterium]|nr:cell division protein ZapE [Cardiobacteriaceae bacterium]
MNLLEHYRASLRKHHYQEDVEQIKMLHEMQRISDALLAAPQATPEQGGGFFAKWFGRNADMQPKSKAWVKGLYAYGGVGRGKTFMMDLFMEHHPSPRKRRRHYHRFMLELHESLRALGNVADPMDKVVKALSDEIDVLCLDEFAVSDITDAMLLWKLFSAMEHYGITLITTSNIIPHQLYKNGLQRERFLPAIAWIEEKLVVHEILDGEDYRRRHFRQEDVFRFPRDENSQSALLRDLANLSGNPLGSTRGFLTGGREIPVLARNDHALAFSFETLCEGYYSQKDYIDIAKRFSYVGIDGVPIISEDKEDAARRFLLLIDEFYDRGVKLLLTLDAAPNDIYQGKKLSFEYARLQSRLFEMQSALYWQQPHQP